ncbi:MAG: potassium/proton antiporter [Burkholderiales bacterium]|jgi:cell volume regulation protein A|nr:potassium/proton antiporter [Burkholderiales bacterium]
MDIVNQLLLVGASLLAGAIVLGRLSERAGLPLLLVFLVVGMLAGEDGPGGIVFDDVRTSFLVGNLALAVILLDGGLRTRYAVFRAGLAPALSLATVGVLLTAGLVAVAAAWLLGLDWRYALLLGAIVGSTDAAAVFAILRASGVRLKQRAAATLEIESGVNDPMAVFLTLTVLESIRIGSSLDAAGAVVSLGRQFAIGAAVGYLGGQAIGFALERMRLAPGLAALFVVACGVAAFAATNHVGGSGFLAVYLVGLGVGNRGRALDEEGLRALDGLAWLAQAAMFLILGLLVTPSELPAVTLAALGVAAWLMLVARPLAVAASLAPFRLPWRETAFVSWVGLRGAVPIVLALFPLMAGLPGARLLFNVAFFVVLVSLLVQGASVAAGARFFRVAVPPAPAPLARQPVATSRGAAWELVQFAIAAESRAAGQPARALAFPADARLVSVLRAGVPLDPVEATLQVDDVACLLCPAGEIDALAEFFAPEERSGPLATQTFFGEFVLDAGATLGEIARAYGTTLPTGTPEGLAVGAYLSARAHGRVVVGDRAMLGPLELTVREMDGGQVSRVGLKLPRER